MIGLLLWTGCVSAPVDGPVVSYRTAPLTPDLEQTVRSTCAAVFPARADMVHRAVITAGTRQFALTGSLTSSDSGRLQLVLLNPLGVVARVVCDARGTIETVEASLMFRKRWAKRYVPRDLHILFNSFRAQDAEAGLLDDGRLVLETLDPKTDDVVRHIFNAAGTEWVETDILVKGRRRYRVTCRARRIFDGYDQPIPAQLHVDAETYRLDLSIVDVRPATDDEAGTEPKQAR